MTILASKTFTAELVRETTFNTSDLGVHESKMDLHRDGESLFIEWDVPSLEITEHIGFELDGKHVVGYDGIMGYVPKEAAELLSAAGYTIDQDCLG